MESATAQGELRSWVPVRRYDWRAVPVPAVDSPWEPTDTISVVIPAFDCQPQLDLTLAALSAQRYPEELFEVIVADDGSATPLTVPEAAPTNTTILRLDRTSEWGRARACAAGAEAAQGEILLFLDADMIVFPDHLRAHARWHHVVAEAVTLGHKLFVDCSGIDAADVIRAARRDEMLELLADRPHQEHEWVERVIHDSDDLTIYHPEMFRAAVGANVGLRAELYRESGGFRTELRAGEDMEMGYRLMTSGAVFIPERQARSWHQGPATFMSRAAEVRRGNDPHFANLIPVPGRFRPHTMNRQYTVPMIAVIVAGAPTDDDETVRQCVDAVLASDEFDLRIQLARPGSDTDSMAAWYQGEPRVVLHEEPPATGHPSRFTIELPAVAGVAASSIRSLVELAEARQLGLLRVVLPTATGDVEVRLWRTAALHRARRHAASTALEDVARLAEQLFGAEQLDASEGGIMDLRITPARGDRKPSPPDQRRDKAQRRKSIHPEQEGWRKRYVQLRRQHMALRQRHAALHRRYNHLRRQPVVRALLVLRARVRRQGR